MSFNGTSTTDKCASHRDELEFKDVLFLGIAAISLVIALASFAYARHVVRRCARATVSTKGILSDALEECHKTFMNPSYVPEPETYKPIWEDDEQPPGRASSPQENIYCDIDGMHDVPLTSTDV